MQKSADILIPVYYGNLHELNNSVQTQLKFYNRYLQNYSWKIIIAVNGPKEKILNEAKRLSKLKNVLFTYTPKPGRGESLTSAYKSLKSDYFIYMDVDLATNLSALPLMLKELDQGNDLVVGSKYIKGSKFRRNWFRLLISFVFNFVFVKLLLDCHFTDSQCGFKGIRKNTARKIIGLINDKGWFFDTELLYVAEKKGYKIKEIPVVWKEGANSGVKVFKTIHGFFVKTLKLKFRKDL